jgi:hypothetical protein
MQLKDAAKIDRILTLVGYVAADGECLMTRGSELLRCGTYRILMVVRQDHRRTRLGEGFSGCQTYARAGASNERDFVLKRQIHDGSP